MKLDKQTNLYNNYDIWHTPFWQTNTFHILIGIIIFLFFCVIMWLLIRAYKKRKAQCVLTPWEKALQELDQLCKSGFINASQGKTFYLAATSIIKTYLKDRFNYDVLGKTDDEVIIYLKNKKFSLHLIQTLENIFKGAVYIKFANTQAVQEQIKQDFTKTLELIKKTIPKEK